MDRERTVVLLSGGMDSATLLYWILNRHKERETKAVSFDYGQRHRKELSYAQRLCDHLGLELRTVDLSSINPLLKGSSQSDASVEVPEGRYDEPSMKLTVVPNRNMVMLSIASAWAISLGYDYVAYAAHSGDHAIYPDCRPEFIRALDSALGLADWKRVRLLTPFMNISKGDIAAEGVKLQVPFDLTWSCYKGLHRHCGKCGACTERKEAFQTSGAKDPTEYMQ